MKLNKLRGAIRKPGNPSMIIDLGNGVPMTLAVVGLCHLVGNILGGVFADLQGEDATLASSFFWVVVVATTIGVRAASIAVTRRGTLAACPSRSEINALVAGISRDLS